jgi:hypothetical protein
MGMGMTMLEEIIFDSAIGRRICLLLITMDQLL